MKETGSETAQRIILAAIGIINTTGTRGITTRRIAEAAGVNSAAMNYHFGSRENLIRRVLDMTLGHMFQDWEMILNREDLSPSERVYFFLDYNMEGTARYPGLARSYLFDRDLSGCTRKVFTEKLNETLNALSESPEMKLAMGQAMGSILSSAVIPELFTTLTGGNISSEKNRRSFILPLVNRIPGLHLEISLPFLEKMENLRAEAFKE